MTAIRASKAIRESKAAKASKAMTASKEPLELTVQMVLTATKAYRVIKAKPELLEPTATKAILAIRDSKATKA